MPTKPSDFGPRRCSADSGTKGQHSRHWLTSCAGRSPSAAWGDTNLTLSQLARQPGYGEQSELSRSCRRWDAASPAARARGQAANARLHARWVRFDARKKCPVVANAAIARELAG